MPTWLQFVLSVTAVVVDVGERSKSAAYPVPDGSRMRESRSSLDVPIRYDRETKALGEKDVYVVGMGEDSLVSRYAIGSRNSMEKPG
jgi:hypothetical protein